MKKFDKIKYNNSFNKEHYDTVTINFPKGYKEILKSEYKKRGAKSLNVFLASIIYEFLEQNPLS